MMLDPLLLGQALSILGPIIAATFDALNRGDDWRKAVREALDAADAADHGLAGPRADAIEAKHRARVAAEAAEREARGDEPTRETKVPT